MLPRRSHQRVFSGPHSGPSPLRLAEEAARRPPDPFWEVKIFFGADGETDSFSRRVQAPDAEGAEVQAYTLLVREYGGDLDFVEYTTTRL